MAIYDIREYMNNANKLFETVLIESPGGVSIIKLAHYFNQDAGTSGRGSDKVWGLAKVGDAIHSFWGRRGQKLASKHLSSEAEATERFHSKLGKGYKDVGNNAPGWVLKDGLPELVNKLTSGAVEEEYNPADPTYSEFEPGGEAVDVEVEVQDGIEETDHVEAEYDYGNERSSKGHYNMDAYDYKGRAEHTGRKLRITNNYGDNPMVMDEGLTEEEIAALAGITVENKDFMREYREFREGMFGSPNNSGGFGRRPASKKTTPPKEWWSQALGLVRSGAADVAGASMESQYNAIAKKFGKSVNEVKSKITTADMRRALMASQSNDRPAITEEN